MKRILLFAVVVLTIIMLMGCEEEKVKRSDLPTVVNQFGTRSIEFDNNIGDMVISTRYSTDYSAGEWRITDSKNILMEAWIKGSNYPDGTVVLVEHVHSDISIKSTLASYDGWKQDTMDDSIHGSIQPGFWITRDYKYQNVFAIEGLTEQILKGYMIGVYGYSSGSWTERTITENDFIAHGKVYAEKMQVVYDILVKEPNEDYYHTYSFINEFLISVGE